MTSISQYIWSLIDFVYQVCFQFSVSALTIRRQLPTPQPSRNPDMAARHEETRAVSDPIYELCRAGESISTMLAKDPSIEPGDAWKSLYGQHEGKDSGAGSAGGSGEDGKADEALKRAAECGKWGPTQPSQFFLQVGPPSPPEMIEESANQTIRSITMPCAR